MHHFRPSGDKKEEAEGVFSLPIPLCKGKKVCSLAGSIKTMKVFKVKIKVS